MITWRIILLGLVAYVGNTQADIQPLDLIKYLENPEPQLSLKPIKTTEQRLKDHGYPAESHKVVTEDGYVLNLFRIPYSHKLQNQDKPRPVVLLQHGLFSCSDIWLTNGPDDSLAFNLADAGFDVWLGNARGNVYSRNHMTRSLNHPYFWRFSWHEIGKYDVAAMIDYALATNGQNQKSLHYVGHSQGTTVLFVLLSERPEYNEKIRTAHMLAPIAIMKNMSDLLVRSLAPFLGHNNLYSKVFDNQEFVPHNTLFNVLGYNACRKNSPFSGFCSSIASYVQTADTGSVNMTALTDMLVTHPAGSSTNQICHYLQEQQSGCFCQYDWGVEKNLKLYGQSTPPDYPVSLITAALHLWYSDNDTMAAVEDVEKIAELLPNRVMHHMEDPKWGHGDYTFSLYVKEFINDPVIEIMQNYEANIGDEIKD